MDGEVRERPENEVPETNHVRYILSTQNMEKPSQVYKERRLKDCRSTKKGDRAKGTHGRTKSTERGGSRKRKAARDIQESSGICERGYTKPGEARSWDSRYQKECWSYDKMKDGSDSQKGIL